MQRTDLVSCIQLFGSLTIPLSPDYLDVQECFVKPAILMTRGQLHPPAGWKCQVRNDVGAVVTEMSHMEWLVELGV